MDAPIVELPAIKDIDEFNRIHKDKVDVSDITDTDKRYMMFIEKKKNLKLPLTFQEQKIINILI